MQYRNYRIDFGKVLQVLGEQYVLLMNVENNSIHIASATANTYPEKRLYLSGEEQDFNSLYSNNIVTELFFIITAEGEITETHINKDDNNHAQLLKAVKSNLIIEKEGSMYKVYIAFLSLVLILMLLLMATMVANSYYKQNNPFQVLDKVEVPESIEYTPGTYRVTVGDFNRTFEVQEINGHSFKCKDNISLWVSNTLDVWKGNVLVLRFPVYQIEKVK